MMPRTKTGPTRDKRLTALLSEKEMGQAQRMVKKLEEVSNLSELVRMALAEKASIVLARKPRQPKAEAAPPADAESKPKRKRGRPRKTVQVEVVEAAPKRKRGRPRKNTNGVAAATA